MYAVLSALDFGVAFAGINLLGAEHVSRVVASVKESVLAIVHSRPPEPGREEMDDPAAHAASGAGQDSLYAMLVLAYTIHKTLFLPVRVGLTAAFTPKLVGWLTRRGWVGSQGAKRAAAEMREKIRR
jgi:N-terminal acetyltransferase 2